MTDNNAPIETWRPVEGYESRYEVSDQGRVRSLPKGNILKPSTAGRGYLRVQLCMHGVARGHYVHHLVAVAFLGPRPEGMEVCHGNGIITDARASNLRYDTHHANMRDSLRHGTHHSVEHTRCTHGHDLTPENTYRHFYKSADGGIKYRVRCKTCMKVKSKLDYAAWKERHGK